MSAYIYIIGEKEALVGKDLSHLVRAVFVEGEGDPCEGWEAVVNKIEVPHELLECLLFRFKDAESEEATTTREEVKAVFEEIYRQAYLSGHAKGKQVGLIEGRKRQIEEQL